MASGWKTAAWTAVSIGSLFIGGTIPLIVKGAVALFAGYEAWKSHKQNQAQEEMAQARAHYMANRVTQQQRALALQQAYGADNGMGEGRVWTDELGRGQGRTR